MTAYGARTGPAGTIWQCLLMGEDRKWPVGGQNSAFDPLQKWGRGSLPPCRHRNNMNAINLSAKKSEP